MDIQGSPRPVKSGSLPGMVLRYVQAVAWSFFGIRRGAGAREDIGRLRPVPLIVTGLLLAAGFVAGLLVLARVAVAGFGA